MILGGNTVSDPHVSLILTEISIASGNATIFGLTNARTTGDSGGGCAVFAIVTCQTDAEIVLFGYGYDQTEYDYVGRIVGIMLS